ncbi:T-complex protein [Gracilaria domingensis]|nr:T-complex protein [Gracilaria domingensis]
MSPSDLYSPPSSPRTGSPCSVVIEIPAHEFQSLPSNTPPPRAAPKTCSWERRLREAEALRNATLNSLQLRCREHVQHVMSVVNTVKESRRNMIYQRDKQLRSNLADADLRRRELLTRRADNADVRVQRARYARESSEQKKNGERARGRRERRLAHHRRLRYLSERKERARRFSPQRRINCSSLSDGPSASTTTSGNADDVTREISFDNEERTSEQNLESSPVEDGQGSQHYMLCENRRTPPSDEEYCGISDRVSDKQTYAAAIIAGYYMLGKARRALSEAGVIGANVTSYDFSRVTSCLETEASQKAAQLALRAFGLCSYASGSLPDYESTQKPRESRILLACLLLSLHPHAVLNVKKDDHNSIERLTFHCARRMLLCLHVATLSACCKAWKKWRQAFLAWKKSDATAFVKAMINDAIATEALRMSVERGFSRSTKVNAVSHALGDGSAASSSEVEYAKQEHTVWEESIAEKQRKIREAIVRIAGAEGERRLNAALEAAMQAKNEQLVHEILIDLPGLLHNVSSTQPVPDETWDRLQEQLSMNPPRREELSQRLTDITQAFANMLSGSFSLVAEEEDSITTLDAGFAVAIVLKTTEALKRCQAQVDDEGLEHWTNEALRRIQSASNNIVQVVVDILRELTARVRSVQVDVLTYRISHSAPIVQQYGDAWERSHFQSHIVAQEFEVTLPRTRELFSQTLSELGANERNLGDDLRKGDPEAVRVLLSNAIVRLVLKPQIYRRGDLPELLHLDLDRITRMQNDIQRCVIVAALDNIRSQYMQSRNISTHASSRMWEVLKVTGSPDCTMLELQDIFASVVRQDLNERNQSVSDGDDKFLRAMVKRIADPEDQTYSILMRRIQEVLVEISVRTCGTRHYASNIQRASQVWADHNRKGLIAVKELIVMISSQVSALVSHLALVHDDTLRDILSRV